MRIRGGGRGFKTGGGRYVSGSDGKDQASQLPVCKMTRRLLVLGRRDVGLICAACRGQGWKGLRSEGGRAVKHGVEEQSRVGEMDGKGHGKKP